MKSIVLLLATGVAVSAAAQPGFDTKDVVRRVHGDGREASHAARLALDDGEFLVDTSGTHPEDYPAAAFDGTNYLVVWEDQRGGSWHVYGTRVSQAGAALDPGGILISTPPYGGAPAVASDGTNFLVVWEVYLGPGSLDIYGARVNQVGDVLDPEGIPISAAGSGQSSPAVSFNGTSFLVVWTDSRNGSDDDIYGARVSQAGTVLDPAGIPISTAARGQYDPAVCFDGTNWLVVWDDYRFMSYDIYGARVRPGGSVLDPEGIAISIAGDYQQYPAVTFDGSNCLVVWEDYRDGSDSGDIYGARVTQEGNVLDPEGIPVSTGAIAYSGPSATFDGANWSVAWADWRSGISSDIYGARVSPSGVVSDSGPVVRQEGDQSSPALACGLGSQVLLVYQGWAGAVGGKTYNVDRIWGKMNPVPGVEESRLSSTRSLRPQAIIVHDVLYQPTVSGVERRASIVLLDINGRKVMDLRPGPNSITGLAPGVYFLHTGTVAEDRKIVLLP